MSVSYKEAEQQFVDAERTKPATRPYTAKQAEAVRSFAKNARSSRANFLHRRDLLAREDIAKNLNIKDRDTLAQFALSALRQIEDVLPAWAKLATVKGLGLKDIETQLPKAKINSSLAIFVIKTGSKPIDIKKLSDDAVEAVAAASLVVAATIMAAAHKIRMED